MPRIDGYFERGRPFVSARLVVPRLRFGRRVEFLVDTGSDVSVLQGRDAEPLTVDDEIASRSATILTPVGSAGASIEQALVLLKAGRISYVFEIRLLIPEPTPATENLPSLLGRDVLNRMDMAYSPRRERLRLSFDSADQLVRDV